MPRKRKEILVSVVKRSDRKHLIYQWEDRVSGNRGWDSAETASRREAMSHDRMSALIDSIKAKRKPKKTNPEWRVFRERYERSRKTEWRPNTLAAWITAVNALEGAVQLDHLSDLDAGAINDFRVALHGSVRPTTIDTYLRSIRAAVRWAADIYPAYKPPKIKTNKPPSAGRPLVDEEFQRMLKACAAVVGKENAGSWRFLLHGLVLSGLRLGQALNLSWEIEAPVHVENLDGPYPKIVIRSSDHKGHRDDQLAMGPPLIAKLRQVPQQQRTGHVFNPRGSGGVIRNMNRVSAIICDIGEEAGVVVGTRVLRKKNKDSGKKEVIGEGPKFAGAHDLKRTFTERLLLLGCHPATIAKLAQHRTFDTTQRHYLGDDARKTSEYLQRLYATAGEK
jgi:integrase